MSGGWILMLLEVHLSDMLFGYRITSSVHLPLFHGLLLFLLLLLLPVQFYVSASKDGVVQVSSFPAILHTS